MDEKFIECCFNAKHAILGYKLKPYSLSHLLVLEGRNNPLVTGEGRITAAHTIDALAVCSRVQFPFRRNRVTLYGKVCRGLIGGNLPLFKETLLGFRDYQDDFVTIPEFWDDVEQGTATLSGPYVLAIAVSVMMAFPQLTETRVWTMPLGLLLWYGAQASEFKAGRRFWNAEGEDEIEEGLRRAEAEITPAMREKARKFAAAHTLPKNGAGGIHG